MAHLAQYFTKITHILRISFKLPQPECLARIQHIFKGMLIQTHDLLSPSLPKQEIHILPVTDTFSKDFILICLFVLQCFTTQKRSANLHFNGTIHQRYRFK